MIRKTSLLLFCLFAGLYSRAQVFGGNPPSLHWKQIKTDTVRVIFPPGLTAVANEVASLAGQLGRTQRTLGKKMRPISIVLQTLPTVSNGYVGLAPRRSEFYMTAEQNSFDLGSLPWSQQLLFHEFRHVQQYNNFRKGISKLGLYIAGESGLTLMNSAAIPNWFWEGDAVFQETRETRQGRGRLPSFYNGYRSLWSADKKYSWMKLRNGSLRDYVPDHYQLGFLLTAYGRERYGENVWAGITDDAVRFKGLFYPFQRAVKKATQVSYVDFRKQALNHFQLPKKILFDSASRWAATQKHFAGDIAHPQWIDKDRLIYVKSSYRQVPHFMILNVKSGEEETLVVKNISLDAYFSARKNTVVYAARNFDRRWGWKEYNDIVLLDIDSKRSVYLTKQKRYFSPDISPDGKSIIAVHVGTDGKLRLDQLSATDGTVIRSVSHPDGFYYSHPRFFDKETIVSAVRDRQGQMSLAKIDLRSGQHEWLLPFSMNVIGFPYIKGDTICFTASFKGRDQLFALVGNSLFRLETPGFNIHTGSYQPALQNGQLAWVDFTAAGQKLSYTQMKPGDLQSVDPSQFSELELSVPLRSLQNDSLIAGATGNGYYESKRYSPLKGLLNFHSWLPYVNDPEYTLSFTSDNILNTMQSEVFFTYNTNEESKQIGASATYAGLFPWIRLGGSFIKDRKALYNNNVVEWDEWEMRAGLSLPLNFSGGRHFTQWRIGTDFVIAQPSFKGLYKDTFSSRSYAYLSNSMQFSNQVQKAVQHIYPHFAQSVRMEFNKGVSRLEGNQFLVNGQWFFPGLGTNHSLVLQTAFQVRDTLRRILFTNNFPFSRGYIGRNFHQMWRAGINYHMPLWYPDMGMAQLLFVQRVRSNIFFDYTHIMDYNSSRQQVTLQYRSMGAEVFFDTKWWNQQPISFGFRYSRLLDAGNQGLGENQWEVVLPVNVFGR